MSLSRKEIRARYYKKYKQEIRLKQAEYYKKNKNRLNIVRAVSGRIYHQNWRRKIIKFLGGKCMGCGISDERVLQIDHINGDGFKEKHFPHTKKFRLILKNKEKYQLLCANCNWIKRYKKKEYMKRKDSCA